MTPNRQRARSNAKKLIHACGITAPPIHLSQICQHLDIFVDNSISEKLERARISAFIDLEDKIISYNDRDPVVRKRFSVAHEIGHLVMGHSVGTDIFNMDSRDPREIEANIFAAELLMPFDWVKEDMKKYGVKIPDIAKKYWVSNEAMGWRLYKSDVLLLS